MKYARLTKEQLEEMHEEFSTFLATQGIDAKEWTEIKAQNPDLAEEEIDIFSDLVWDKVLQRVKYLEHFSKQQIFLFKTEEFQISLIALKVDNSAIDLLTPEGYQWLRNNLKDDQVTIYTSTKPIGEERNSDIFALIKQGANITKGELYSYFEKIVSPE
ncbi:MAG TPA: DUF6495 family protein [Flavobacteriaceae bacterium]|nr:DUF6495 family protein [Flavobacteriaceae bacterium]